MWPTPREAGGSHRVERPGGASNGEGAQYSEGGKLARWKRRCCERRGWSGASAPEQERKSRPIRRGNHPETLGASQEAGRGGSAEGPEKPRRVSTPGRLQYAGSRARTPAEQKPLRARPGRRRHLRMVAASGRNVERGAPGDEPGGARPEGNTLKGDNPMSASGMKQGRSAGRGSNPRGSEKGRGGKAFGVEPEQCADSTPVVR
jgi:hypothetical protein